jgi:uncharacterized protein
MTEIMLWRRLDLPGHEIARLGALDDGWKLAGTAVFAHQQGPSKLDYVVICDAAWRTNAAQVRGMIGGREIDLSVSVDAERRWRLNGAECAAVEGCMDIDLGFSPSTNLLPIRRLALVVGDEAEVRAAWLPFPSLEFELLPQVYRREGETTYRYESRGGRFVRTLEVNAAGFVASYPGLWQAESAP